MIRNQLGPPGAPAACNCPFSRDYRPSVQPRLPLLSYAEKRATMPRPGPG